MEYKNNTILIVLLTIFVMLTLGLSGYLVYDNILFEKDKVDNKTPMQENELNESKSWQMNCIKII